MTRLVAVVAALATATTALTGCLPIGGCGVADDYDKGTNGTWIVTRIIGPFDGCPAHDDFEQMQIAISDNQVTVLSAGMTLVSANVHWDGDRQLVDLTVEEPWQVDPSSGLNATLVPLMTYAFELVPATARLEGSVNTVFFVDGPEGSEPANCTFVGQASAGRVAE